MFDLENAVQYGMCGTALPLRGRSRTLLRWRSVPSAKDISCFCEKLRRQCICIPHPGKIMEAEKDASACT